MVLVCFSYPSTIFNYSIIYYPQLISALLAAITTKDTSAGMASTDFHLRRLIYEAQRAGEPTQSASSVMSRGQGGGLSVGQHWSINGSNLWRCVNTIFLTIFYGDIPNGHWFDILRHFETRCAELGWNGSFCSTWTLSTSIQILRTQFWRWQSAFAVMWAEKERLLLR